VLFDTQGTEVRLGLPSTGMWYTCVSLDNGFTFVRQSAEQAQLWVQRTWSAEAEQVTSTDPAPREGNDGSGAGHGGVRDGGESACRGALGQRDHIHVCLCGGRAIQ
jgi:hypothetical protein